MRLKSLLRPLVLLACLAVYASSASASPCTPYTPPFPGATEQIDVTWQSFATAAPGSETIGGLTISSDGSTTFSAAQVAAVAAGGTIAGLTITSPASGWTVTAGTGSNDSYFTSTTANAGVPTPSDASSAGSGASPTFTETVVGAPVVLGTSRICSLSPTSGAAAGGTSVVISGSNFTGASVVSFGGTNATSFTVNSATQITATAPAHAVGVVNIIVTTPGGVSQAGVTAQFTFVAIAPPAPTIGSAVAGNAQATVSFTAPVSNGGAAITSYTVTSIPGGITATGTASPITVSGLTNGTSYTFTVTATNSVGAGAASAATNSVTPVSPVPPVVLFTPASLPGVTNSASVVDVGQGLGKTVLACFMDTLRQSLGGNPQFLGQDAYGIVKIAVNGSMYPFYPMQASATDNRGAGIYLTGTNLLDGVSSCGTLSGAPALFDLAAFATAMTQAGWSLQIDAQGVIAAVSGNRAYVGRPAVVATAPGVPGLAFQNASGTFGTTAMTQGLLPAVLDPVALQNVISQLNGAMVVQADATVFVSFGNGKHFVLTPDFLLVAGAAGNTAPAYWQDGVNHYFYRIANGTYANYAQGVTLTPAP